MTLAPEAMDMPTPSDFLWGLVDVSVGFLVVLGLVVLTLAMLFEIGRG